MRKFFVLVLILAVVLIMRETSFSQKTKKQTKTTTQKGPKTVWLKNLKAIGEEYSGSFDIHSEFGAGQLDGNIYTKSIKFRLHTRFNCDRLPNSSEKTIIYNLAKNYDVFEATFGADDTSDDRVFANVEIIGDDQTLYSSPVKKILEKPEFISIDVKDVVRLKILATMATKEMDCLDTQAYLILGDPKLIIGAATPKKETTTTSTKTTNETTEETESSCSGGSSVIIDPKTMETLANNLAAQVKDAGITNTGKVQLAITKFKLVDVCNKSVADNVLDDLSTYLLKTKVFKLIEREQLEKAIKELKFGTTGFIEPKKAIELGKMVGAQAILIGSVSDRGSFVVINARIINTKTGEADIAENVEMKK